MRRISLFLTVILILGFAFFYVPILSMMVYSFNGSRLATVWGGFSTKWYVSLLSNDKVIDALVLSLKIALLSATIATILGTMAGITLAQMAAPGAPVPSKNSPFMMMMSCMPVSLRATPPGKMRGNPR